MSECKHEFFCAKCGEHHAPFGQSRYGDVVVCDERPLREQVRSYLGYGRDGKLDWSYGDGYAYNHMVRRFGEDLVKETIARVKREQADV